MATGTLVSVEEYLATTYRPDRDYIDGQVLERNLGERDHSRLQREILFYLGARYPHLRDRLFPEQRVQVKSTRFRVPDICVLAEDAPDEQIVTTPPVLCIEILSPEDTVTRTLDRVRDYFEMGVAHCWIIDPSTRSAWAGSGGLTNVSDGVLRAGAIEMPLGEIFE